jgi:predicted transposase/invertase (TIGR01784 family)
MPRMEIGLDPKNDYAFKRVFGDERTLSILAALLDAVLRPPAEHRLVDLHLLNPFNDKQTLDDKLSILDIKARDQSGRQYNIEMQLLAHATFRERVLYYWAKFHQGQILEGDSYDRLEPTISICFVGTPLFVALPDYHLEFALLERRHQVAFSEHLMVHIMELSKFKKAPAELATPLDRWMYFLCHGEKLDPEALPAGLEDPQIRRALEVLRNMGQSTIERERYEARQKYLHDVATWEKDLAVWKEKAEQASKKAEKATKEAERATKEAERAREESIRAREEGFRAREEGLKEGLVGRIRLCQSLLNRPLTPEPQLRQLPTDELHRLASALESELRNFRPTG